MEPTPTPGTPGTTPTPARPVIPYKLGDFWSLVLLLLAGLLIWQSVTADPGDTAEMLGMRQQVACGVLALVFIIGFVVIGIRNVAKFGRWFTNRAS